MRTEVKHFLRKYIDMNNITDLCLENIDLDDDEIIKTVIAGMNEITFNHLYEDLMYLKRGTSLEVDKKHMIKLYVNNDKLTYEALEFIDKEIRYVIHDVLMDSIK